MRPLIILDPGHGGHKMGRESSIRVRQTTKGGLTFYEGLSNRAFAANLQFQLALDGYDTHVIGDIREDNTLTHRVIQVDNIVSYQRDNYGRDCFLISLHSDGFHKESAHGWGIFIANNASSMSQFIASEFSEAFDVEFINSNHKNRGIKKANFSIIRRTSCPAVLIENLFSTNDHEFQMLCSPDQRARLTAYMIAAIKMICLQWDS